MRGDGCYDNERLHIKCNFSYCYSYRLEDSEQTTCHSVYVVHEIESVEGVTLSFESNGGTKIESQRLVKGKTGERPEDPQKDGYRFENWYKDETLTEVFDFGAPIHEDTLIYAKWTKKTSSSGNSSMKYKVTTKAENATITPSEANVKKNTSQEFTITPAEGYEIVDVLIDGKSVGAVNKYTLENVSAKHTIEVKTQKVTLWSNADDWAKEELMRAQEKGLIPETLAKKDFTDEISREDFVAVAVKLYESITGKKATPATNNPFTDTDNENVLKAYHLGITFGISETQFGNLPITREQMATMIARALSKAGINIEIDMTNISKFADDEELHDWSRESVYFMAKEEIIKGIGDNRFNPLGIVKIEEAIAIALRCVEMYSK